MQLDAKTLFAECKNGSATELSLARGYVDNLVALVQNCKMDNF